MSTEPNLRVIYVRCPIDVHEALKAEAKLAGRTLNQHALHKLTADIEPEALEEPCPPSERQRLS